jgi:subtilisin family serine protease
MEAMNRLPSTSHANLIVVALLILLLSGSFLFLYRTPTVIAQTEMTPASDLILVGLDPAVSKEEATALFARQGLTLVHLWRAFDLAAVRPASAVNERASDAVLAVAMQQARALPIVRFAELDGRIEAAVLPNAIEQHEPFQPDDPVYPQQWALEQIGMPTAWTITQGDPSLVVAVLDSGVEIDHEDLGDHIYAINPVEAAGQPGVDDDNNGYIDDLHGWDWVEDDNDPNDQFGHGTHVIGTMAATIDNGVGIAGMGSNLHILPLRVLDARGSGSISDLVSGMDYARRRGAHILNLSLVLRLDSSAIHQALQQLYNDGILMVAATGNYGSQVYWPAAYPETIAVAAVDQNNLHAGFSNAGPETDIAAPGDNVLSTYLDNSYFSSRGTSMAVPHVSALAALIWSLRPDWDRDAVVETILSTAVDVNVDAYPGPDPYLGSGRIDAAAALRQAAAAVEMAVQVPVGSYLSIGQALQIPVRLTVSNGAGNELPVAGGVIEAELLGPSNGASGAQHSQRLFSDEAGYTILDLTLPKVAGQYTLRVTGGGQIQNVDLQVQDGPLLLSVQPAAPEMAVAIGQIDIGLTARTNEGALFTDPLQVMLHTSLGQFANNSQTYTALMTGGD